MGRSRKVVQANRLAHASNLELSLLRGEDAERCKKSVKLPEHNATDSTLRRIFNEEDMDG